MAQAGNSRPQEIKAILKEYPATYTIALAVLFTILGILLGGLLFSDEPGYRTNLYNDALSIFVTVTILDVLAGRREERSRIKDLQEQLVRDASSLVNDVARNAVHQMRKRKWLQGESNLLKGANLFQANLAGSDLSQCNLQKADLTLGNLDKVNLKSSDLSGADLIEANLEDADLRFAVLDGANLKGANLKGVDLRAARLKHIKANQETILPNGKKWTPDIDWRQFGAIIK